MITAVYVGSCRKVNSFRKKIEIILFSIGYQVENNGRKVNSFRKKIEIKRF